MVNEKELEEIIIQIDPETMSYSFSCSKTYVEDVYIILREIISSFENGDISEAFNLEDVTNGKSATREQFAAVIAEIKQKLDGKTGNSETPNYQCRDFRN